MLRIALLALLAADATAPVMVLPGLKRMSCLSREDVGLAKASQDGRMALRQRLLAESDACARLAVAQALVESGPEGRTLVLDMLESVVDEEARRACLGALASGPSDARSIRAATRWFGLPPDVEWVSASIDIVRMGDPIVPLPPYRTIAEHAWWALVDGKPATRELLVGLLSDPEPEIRRRAAWALRVRANEQWGWDAEDARSIEPALAPLEHDADPIVRLAAICRRCPREPEDEKPAALTARARPLLRDSDPFVRHAGLVLLACGEELHADARDLQTLRALARDANVPLESRARAGALAFAIEPSSPELEPLLEACAIDLHPWWCMGTLMSLEDHAERAHALLRRLALAPGRAQAQAIEALRWPLDRPLAVAECVELAGSPRVEVRRMALRSLGDGRRDAAKARECILASLDDPATVGEAIVAVRDGLPDDIAALERAAERAAEHAAELKFEPSSFYLGEKWSLEALRRLTRSESAFLREIAWADLVRRAPDAAHAIEVTRRCIDTEPKIAREPLRRLGYVEGVTPAEVEALHALLPPERR